MEERPGLVQMFSSLEAFLAGVGGLRNTPLIVSREYVHAEVQSEDLVSPPVFPHVSPLCPPSCPPCVI